MKVTRYQIEFNSEVNKYEAVETERDGLGTFEDRREAMEAAMIAAHGYFFPPRELKLETESGSQSYLERASLAREMSQKVADNRRRNNEQAKPRGR